MRRASAVALGLGQVYGEVPPSVRLPKSRSNPSLPVYSISRSLSAQKLTPITPDASDEKYVMSGVPRTQDAVAGYNASAPVLDAHRGMLVEMDLRLKALCEAKEVDADVLEQAVKYTNNERVLFFDEKQPDVSAAAAQFIDHIKWRLQVRADKLTMADLSPELQFAWREPGFTRQGTPFAVIPWRATAGLDHVTEAQYELAALIMMTSLSSRFMDAKNPEKTGGYGEFSLIYDMMGFNGDECDSPFHRAVAKLIDMQFPRRIDTLYICNTGKGFKSIWSTVKSVYAPQIAPENVRVIKEDILRYIPDDQLPFNLGGRLPDNFTLPPGPGMVMMREQPAFTEKDLVTPHHQAVLQLWAGPVNWDPDPKASDLAVAAACGGEPPPRRRMSRAVMGTLQRTLRSTKDIAQSLGDHLSNVTSSSSSYTPPEPQNPSASPQPRKFSLPKTSTVSGTLRKSSSQASVGNSPDLISLFSNPVSGCVNSPDPGTISSPNLLEPEKKDEISGGSPGSGRTLRRKRMSMSVNPSASAPDLPHILPTIRTPPTAPSLIRRMELDANHRDGQDGEKVLFATFTTVDCAETCGFPEYVVEGLMLKEEEAAELQDRAIGPQIVSIHARRLKGMIRHALR